MPQSFLRFARIAAAAVLGIAAMAMTRADAPVETGAPRRGERFQNNYVEFEPKGLAALVRWKIDASREGLPKPPQQPTPRVAPDLAFLRANAVAGSAMVPAVTWIGHASTLVQAGGSNILTDPIFSERASPLPFFGPKRHVPPGDRHRRFAAHRRRRRVAQPLRPPRRGERARARRAARRRAALRRAARHQGLARAARHRPRGRARLVAERARRRGRDRL